MGNTTVANSPLKLHISKNNIKRVVMLAFLFFFVIASVLAQAYIISNINHNCTGDGCPICAYIRQMETFLAQIGAAAIIILIMIALLFAIISVPLILESIRVDFLTLISIKARMNN